MRAEGAPDCMVVNVVVVDRTEGAGDEKVLPAPPSAPLKLGPPAVPLVPALEFAVSDRTVSEFVATVGAIDL